MQGKKIILAVDDMAENLTIIRTMLGDFFDVRLAKSASLALTMLANTTVDLLLLDIEMPGMSGFEFLKAAREKDPEFFKTPVIFVTSHASSDFIDQAINAGARDYIVKPIREEVLFKKIDSLIGFPDEEFAPLEEALHEIYSACAAGNSAKAEEGYQKASEIAKNMSDSVRERVAELERSISVFDYEKTLRRLEELSTYMKKLVFVREFRAELKENPPETY